MVCSLNRLHIYGLDILGEREDDNIYTYIKTKLVKTEVVLHPDIVSEFVLCSPSEKEKIIDESSVRLAKCRVYDITCKETLSQEPMYGEIVFEKRNLYDPKKTITGIIYDGFGLQSIYMKFIKKIVEQEEVCIIIINRLIGTWDIDDLRYHARVVVFGIPCIISIPGIIEAPARPRDYYIEKQNALLKGTSSNYTYLIKEIDAKYRDRFIDYDDKRIPEIIKGYIMQCVFYNIAGNPFCNDKSCRLHNAHWQEDMINAQLGGSYEFCDYHKDMLENFLNA